MIGEKFQICLTDDAVPFAVSTPRNVPYNYMSKLKLEIEQLLKDGVIMPVTEPTDWCSPITVVPKTNDKIRMCVDLTKLNKYIRWERYPNVTPLSQVANIAKERAKFFTSVDAAKGFYQVELDEDSQLLTTFITPFGRFKFLRAPFGISSISEHYNRRMDEAMAGLDGYRKIVDDIVIYDDEFESHVQHVRSFLQRCRDQRITLNEKKFVFGAESVTFAGLHLSKDGYHLDDNIVKAIKEFAPPRSRTDLRSFLGLVNQLSSSSSAISAITAPLRPLLSAKHDFVWNDVHEDAFKKAKQAITSSPVLDYYDPRRET